MGELRIKPGISASPNEVFGTLDSNLKLIESDCGVEIVYRGDEIIINGEEAERAANVIQEMFTVVESGQHLDEQKVNYILSLSRDGISSSVRFSGFVKKFQTRFRNLRAPSTPELLHGLLTSRGPMNIRYKRSVSAP